MPGHLLILSKAIKYPKRKLNKGVRMMSHSSNLKLDHLFYLTDYTGIIQHSKYSVPDFETGYTTDDNARALIIATNLYNKNNDNRLLTLIVRYLSFLHYGQNSVGRWKNFMNYQRQFIEEQGSEDSFGRSLWGLGYLYSTPGLPKGVPELNNYLIKKAIPNINKLKAYRAQAYALIGLAYLFNCYSKLNVKKLIENLADRLVKLYNANKTVGWEWFEDIVTYANGILPYSLLKAYHIVQKDTYLKVSLELLDFLEGLVMRKGYLKLVGCNGWAVKGGPQTEFDEQPIDAADMVLAYSEAFKVTGNIQYFQKSEICFKWFHGLNCHKVSLVNTDTGGCFDGLTKSGINLNQGAESLFAYMISYLTAEDIGILDTDELRKKSDKIGSFEQAV